MSRRTIAGIVLIVFTLMAGGCAVYVPGGYPDYPYGGYYYNPPVGYYGYGPWFSFGFFGGDSHHGGFYHHEFRGEGEHFEHH